MTCSISTDTWFTHPQLTNYATPVPHGEEVHVDLNTSHTGGAFLTVVKQSTISQVQSISQIQYMFFCYLQGIILYTIIICIRREENVPDVSMRWWSHEKSEPTAMENAGTNMLSTCKHFPWTDNARILFYTTARPHTCVCSHSPAIVGFKNIITTGQLVHCKKVIGQDMRVATSKWRRTGFIILCNII